MLFRQDRRSQVVSSPRRKTDYLVASYLTCTIRRGLQSPPEIIECTELLLLPTSNRPTPEKVDTPISVWLGTQRYSKEYTACWPTRQRVAPVCRGSPLDILSQLAWSCSPPHIILGMSLLSALMPHLAVENKTVEIPEYSGL